MLNWLKIELKRTRSSSGEKKANIDLCYMFHEHLLQAITAIWKENVTLSGESPCKNIIYIVS